VRAARLEPAGAAFKGRRVDPDHGMIRIVRKPTDAPGDDSTSQVCAALDARGAAWEDLDLDLVDPFACELAGSLIWACGLKQDGHQFEALQALALSNRVVNTPDAIATCASKVATTALLLRAGLPSPATGFLRTREQAAAFIAAHGRRAVFKPVYGFDGNGIRLVASAEDLDEPSDHEERRAVVCADVVDGKNVGVGETRDGQRLPLEPLQPIRIAGERRRQHLDGDVAVQPRIVSAIDGAHATGAEQGDNLERADASAG
jgi:hypothetical protein